VAAAANAMNSTKYSGIPQQLRNIPAGMPQFQMDPRNRINQQPGYRQGKNMITVYRNAKKNCFNFSELRITIFLLYLFVPSSKSASKLVQLTLNIFCF